MFALLVSARYVVAVFKPASGSGLGIVKTYPQVIDTRFLSLG